MKILRKPYLAFLLSTLFLFVSCNQYDTHLDNNENLFSTKNNSELLKISIELAKNENFIELSKRMYNFSKHTFDIEKLEFLSEKESLNDVEKLEYSKSLGFKSIEETANFDILNFEAISNIYTSYHFEKLSNIDIFTIYKGAFNLTLPSSEKSTCKDRLRNCNLVAAATYALTVTGCVATGIGLGAVSFICLGCVGWAVGTACVAGATVLYSTSLNSCYYSYEDCNNN